MIINKIKSNLLLLKASRYQGRGDFKKVIELSLNALELNPRSLLASILLADVYPRLGKYNEAKALLTKALKFYPEDYNLNFIMGEVLVKNKEPVQNAIPFLENYLKIKPNKKGSFPWYAKLFTIFSKKKIDLQKQEKEWNEYEDAKTQWALKILQWKQGDMTNTPATDTSKTTSPVNVDESRFIINMQKGDEIWVGNEKVDLTSIKSKVEDFKNKYPDGEIIIACDKDFLNKKAIEEVLEQVGEAKVIDVVVAVTKVE
jgi:tetratricopeptide (TPR) repeat protein